MFGGGSRSFAYVLPTSASQSQNLCHSTASKDSEHDQLEFSGVLGEFYDIDRLMVVELGHQQLKMKTSESCNFSFRRPFRPFSACRYLATPCLAQGVARNIMDSRILMLESHMPCHPRTFLWYSESVFSTFPCQ